MATTIKQILEWPVGYKSGGFVLTVKTVKKHWEVPQEDGCLVGHKDDDRILVKQAVLTDGTGDLLADIKICSPEHGNHLHLAVGHLIRVITCEVQTAYDGKGKDPTPNKKLYIDQYEDYVKQPVGRGEQPWGSEDDNALAWAEARKEEIKGKIRHGLACAYMRTTPPDTLPGNPVDDVKKTINLWVDFIMTGE